MSISSFAISFCLIDFWLLKVEKKPVLAVGAIVIVTDVDGRGTGVAAAGVAATAVAASTLERSKSNSIFAFAE